jgi:hypothetical protein
MSKTKTTNEDLKVYRTRMASLIAAHSGATLDAEAIVDYQDNLVVTGTTAELGKVRDAMHAAGVQCTVEDAEPGDEDWTCARIPLASIERALLALRRAVRK